MCRGGPTTTTSAEDTGRGRMRQRSTALVVIALNLVSCAGFYAPCTRRTINTDYAVCARCCPQLAGLKVYECVP